MLKFDYYHHRQLWDIIAKNPGKLPYEIFEDLEWNEITEKDFCCDYAMKKYTEINGIQYDWVGIEKSFVTDACRYCPLEWPTEDCTCGEIVQKFRNETFYYNDLDIPWREQAKKVISQAIYIRDMKVKSEVEIDEYPPSIGAYEDYNHKKHVQIWNYLYENPFDSKDQAFKKLGLQEENVLNNCYACKQSLPRYLDGMDYMGGPYCENCPINWPMRNHRSKPNYGWCEDSIYGIWSHLYWSGFEDSSLNSYHYEIRRKRLAKLIRDAQWTHQII